MTSADLVRAHYDALDRSDMDGMIAALAPDVRWTEAAGFPYAGTYIGPDAVITNVFERIQQDWDAYSLTLDEVVDGGDTIVGVGTYSGIHKRTGRFFAARVAHVWHFAEGRVIAFEQFPDTELVNRATRA